MVFLILVAAAIALNEIAIHEDVLTSVTHTGSFLQEQGMQGEMAFEFLQEPPKCHTFVRNVKGRKPIKFKNKEAWRIYRIKQ